MVIAFSVANEDFAIKHGTEEHPEKRRCKQRGTGSSSFEVERSWKIG